MCNGTFLSNGFFASVQWLNLSNAFFASWKHMYTGMSWLREKSTVCLSANMAISVPCARLKPIWLSAVHRYQAPGRCNSPRNDPLPVIPGSGGCRRMPQTTSSMRWSGTTTTFKKTTSKTTSKTTTPLSLRRASSLGWARPFPDHLRGQGPPQGTLTVVETLLQPK